MFYWFLKNILGFFIKLIWLDKVRGLKNIPKDGPLILCANHSSYFDFLMLSVVFPRRIYFLAGEVFFKKWQWKWLMKITGQIKVDRNIKDKSESIDMVLDYLKKDRVVGIFPEGTRSKNGEIGKFYNGAIKIAQKSRSPLLPVGIEGTFEIMSRFDKTPKLNKKCSLNFGKLINYQKNIFKNKLLEFLSDNLKETIKGLINVKNIF